MKTIIGLAKVVITLLFGRVHTVSCIIYILDENVLKNLNLNILLLTHRLTFETIAHFTRNSVQ